MTAKLGNVGERGGALRSAGQQFNKNRGRNRTQYSLYLKYDRPDDIALIIFRSFGLWSNHFSQ